MTLTEHLQELRARLLKSLIAVLICTIVVGVWFYNPLYQFLLHPYCHLPPDRRLLGHDCALTFTGVTDAFTIRLKVALIGGVVLSMPIWLYQLWAFITPGLHRNERRWSLSFVFASVFLFLGGVAIAYLILPKALDVLLGFGGPDLEALLAVDQYLGFIVAPADDLRHLVRVPAGAGDAQPRRHPVGAEAAAVAADVVLPDRGPAGGGDASHQDPITMTAMMVPLWVLYEAAVLFARIHDRRKERREEQSEYAPRTTTTRPRRTFADLDWT